MPEFVSTLVWVQTGKPLAAGVMLTEYGIPFVPAGSIAPRLLVPPQKTVFRPMSVPTLPEGMLMIFTTVGPEKILMVVPSVAGSLRM
jgi:hypothetical protein